MEDLATYLQLAPQFGGTRFGPYEGLTITLGSDPEACHIVLSAALGVHGEHVQIMRQGVQDMIISPSERTADVFLFKAGQARAVQVNTPTAVRHGDAFALVTEDGPRFTIEVAPLPPELQEQRDQERDRRTGRGRLSADSMGSEMKRQAWTRLLVQGPAQILQRAVTFVTSGAIYQPRNIIMMATLGGGWLLGGTMMCSRGKSRNTLQRVEGQLQECNANVGALSGDEGGLDQMGLPTLAGRISGTNRVETGLDLDRKLFARVKESITSIMANPRAYGWWLDGKDNRVRNFITWRESVMESSLDNHIAPLAVWLPMRRGRLAGKWAAFSDSEGEQACGRGPLRLTYRMGLNLGLDVQLDGLARTGTSDVDDEDLLPLLQVTAQNAGVPMPEEMSILRSPTRQGASTCVHQEGADDREAQITILRRLESQIGSDASGVPQSANAQTYAVARVAKFWAQDLTPYARERGGELVFGDASLPSAVLDGYEEQGRWVLEKTAQTLAQAIALPCILVLDNPQRATDLLDRDVNPIDCLIMDYKIRNP
jgi:hypothetical protein